MNQFSYKEINEIAYRIKFDCNGCPDLISHYDLKDEILNVRSSLHIYLMKKAHRDSLFSNLDLHNDIREILNSISTTLDSYIRRRIALFHGAISAPAIYSKSIQQKVCEEFVNFDSDLEKHELKHIFYAAAVDAFSIEPNLDARKRIKLISDFHEGEDSDSLFSNFKTILDKKIVLSEVKLHSVTGGFKLNEKAHFGEILMLLFDFHPMAAMIGNMEHLSTRDQDIYTQILNLQEITFKETMLLFE